MSARVVAALALGLVSTLFAARLEAQGGAPAARVIVELAVPAGPHVPEGRLPSVAAVQAQRRAIADAADRVAARLRRGPRDVRRRFATVPYVVVEADAATRAALAASADVVRVMDDKFVRPSLAQSVPVIQADQAWDAGYDGTGTVVAILDTGVDKDHPFLAGKVIAEACFSSTQAGLSQSTCPNGTEQQIGAGSAVPCSLDTCSHGTHVAGIAAGSGASFSGVAKGAHIVAVQVFSIVTDSASCGGVAPCAGAFNSDIIAGLEYVQSVAGSLNVVSANMSLGGETFAAACDDEPEKPAIDNLRSIGVATVIAAGNDFAGSEIASPACISSAISVGSTTKTNTVSFFSNVAPFLSLFAPGDQINSSVPGGGFEVNSGTSMAAPHVAGAWAILRQAAPGASVATILNAFRSTGMPITDDRIFFGGGSVVPRVSVLQALASLVPVTNPVPTLTSLSPSRLRAGMGPVTLSLTGTGFNSLSAASWNGTPLATTMTNTTSLQATVPIALLTGTSGQVAVTNPSPGGGTTAAIVVPLDPPAVLTVNTTAVPPSTPVTMTLSAGFGGATDWLTLSQVGSSERSYVTYTYVGSGVTTRTWTVTMPSTPGQYEFRYFPDNGYTRAATSPAITVDAALTPAPTITSLSPVSTPVGGPAFTLTVNGSSFTSVSVVRWNGSPRATTFVSATQVRASITAADIAATGTAQVSVLTPAPGGGTSGSLNFLVATPPVLTVNATTVQTGTGVTVTLTNGLGGATDWITFALVSAPNTSYTAYTYVGSGVTTRTWTVTPSSPGTYEFRLFPNNGYTRAATSPAVTVTVATAPVPVVTSLSPSSAMAGAGGFSLTVNGSGFTPSSVVNWNGSPRVTTFVSATQLRASVNAADVAMVGTSQVSVTTAPPGGGTSGSLPFTTVTGPTLSVSTTTAAPGAPITVTMTGGLGGQSDWIAFAATSAANTSYLYYTYIGNGVTTRTWTVTAPATAGTYEFRLFLNNGYTRAATSPTITVTGGSGPAPTLTVSTTTAAPGTAITVTLTGGLGGQSDWIAFAATSAPNTSYLYYTYVGNGVTTRTWTVTAPSTPGTYEFRLFPNNGYTRAATSVSVTVQ